MRKYIKKGTAVEDLSLRKQMCIKYLIWAARKTKKTGYEFYEMTKRWRKEEGRIGGKRTKIEIIGRKFLKVKKEDEFRESRKPGGSVRGKDLVAKRKGFLAPDKWEQHLENLKNAVYHKNREFGVLWVVYPPEGEPFIVRGLAKISEENGLDSSTMIRTANRPWVRRHHKGWRAEKYDPEWHKLTGIEMPDGLPPQEDG